MTAPDNVRPLLAPEEPAPDPLEALDLIYATAPIGLCVLDRALRYVRINAWLARINGHVPEAHIGRTIREMVPGIADVLEPLARQVLETGEPVLEREVRGTTAADPDREHLWIESWYPLHGPHGKVMGLSVVVRDETEVRSAQERITRTRDELRASEARFRGFWDSGLLACQAWHADGRVLEANDAFLEMLGYTREDLRAGRINWRTLTPPGWEDRDAHALHELATRGYSTPFEKQYLHRDGHPIDVIIGGFTVEGQPDAGVAFALDVSARKRDERELRQRRTFEEQLLGIVGHDLRNPLASVLLGVSLLQRQTDDGAFLRTLARMERSARRMQGIIGGLLDVTRVRSGLGLALDRRPVDLARVIEGVVEELASTHPGRLELRLGGDLSGEWDPARLDQLISNLVTNALQHGEANGPVLVEAGESADGVLFAVHNGGTTIPAEQLSTIFEPFQRGTNAGRVDGSVGLGLFIADEIARAHGGRIEAASAAGRTTFRMFLPRR